MAAARPRTICQAGQFATSEGTATTDRVCAGCPSATFTASSGSSQCTAWSVCVAGSFVSLAGSATADQQCQACPSATYSSGSNQSACMPTMACPAGTTQTAAGSTSMPPTCAACAPGTFCAGAANPAVPCADGTFDHDVNPATACVPQTRCIAGQSVADAGGPTTDRTCAACASGTFSTLEKQSTCSAFATCQPGHVGAR